MLIWREVMQFARDGNHGAGLHREENQCRMAIPA